MISVAKCSDRHYNLPQISLPGSDLHYSFLPECCITGLEFIYAQSPNNMKGLQTGMFYLIYGVFSAFGSTIHFIYVTHLQQDHSILYFPLEWSLFCVILLSIGLIGLVVYGIVAWCYKNRQRPATDEAEVQRILMYANVYGSKS